MKGSDRAVIKGVTEENEKGLSESIHRQAESEKVTNEGAEIEWEAESDEEFEDDGPLIHIENGDDLRESCKQQ